MKVQFNTQMYREKQLIFQQIRRNQGKLTVILYFKNRMQPTITILIMLKINIFKALPKKGLFNC